MLDFHGSCQTRFSADSIFSTIMFVMIWYMSEVFPDPESPLNVDAPPNSFSSLSERTGIPYSNCSILSILRFTLSFFCLYRSDFSYIHSRCSRFGSTFCQEATPMLLRPLFYRLSLCSFLSACSCYQGQYPLHVLRAQAWPW